MAEPLILDPNEPSGFRPAGGGGPGGGHHGFAEIIDDPIDVGRYEDVDPIDTRGASRPSMAQRVSSMSMNDRPRRDSRPNIKSKRDSVLSAIPEKYMFYRLEKYGDDWEAARKNKLAANQSEMEKQVRKWRGSVISELKAMGNLRASQLQRLVDDANYRDDGDGTWEVVWLESDKVRTKEGSKKCRKMDVILGRSRKSRERSKSAGEIVDISRPGNSNSKDSKKKKDKSDDYDDGPKEHKRKDSVLDDPFQTSVLFHRTGKPMDDHGPLEYANGGLPPEIPHDRPIGALVEKKKDDKNGKRKKLKDRGDDDDIVRVDEMVPDDGVGDIEAILRGGGRSRGGSRAGEPFMEPIEVEPGRSRSRRRPSRGARSKSRLRSQSRPDSIRFPPSFYTQNYMGERVPSDAMSSTSSGESRYGLDREERSSYTSQDTYHDITGRGTHYDDHPRYRDSKHGEKPYYKEHHRGPSGSRSRGPGTPRYHTGADRDVEMYERPGYARRRSSRAYYPEPIPESRRIGYYEDPRRSGALARRSTYDDRYPRERRDSGLTSRDVKLHYPGDMVDLKAQERYRYAEDYQSESVKDEVMDRRERDIRRREDRVSDAEWDNRRFGHYDEGYGGGGGYYR